MTTNANQRDIFDDLISVKEAAKLLHVSESTIWRWIDKELLTAQRVGPKRVCLRRRDVETLVHPVAAPKSQDSKEDLRKYLTPINPNRDPLLTAEEVIARARAFQDRVLARRGGVLFPPSWIDIREMREERDRELFGE